MPLPNQTPDPELNRILRDSSKFQADSLREYKVRWKEEPCTQVEPVTLSMQEYLDIKTIVNELREIEEGLRHRDTGNTLIDGSALSHILMLAKNLALP